LVLWLRVAVIPQDDPTSPELERIFPEMEHLASPRSVTAKVIVPPPSPPEAISNREESKLFSVTDVIASADWGLRPILTSAKEETFK
jgi:hypothetical protein